MKIPNVLSLTSDASIIIDGDNVLDNATQEVVSQINLTMILNLVDLNTGSGGAASIQMTMKEITYLAIPVAIGWWEISMASIIAAFSTVMPLINGHRYIGTLIDWGDNAPLVVRPVKIQEFVIDQDSVAQTQVELPYQIEFSAGHCYMRWYTALSPLGTMKYQAELYEGGTGTTPATRIDRVTHRGPVTPV